ncbi:MAG TPA: MdtA/MuxA family multidrug efflux RND transporter periplasmic adaptor subunit [Stellaceae bacterium]|nr:MdtA/MuxA family multidrug efflux RND transporter periplasmic adaptor subunit [Stellaceae bacterium]
MDDQPPREYLRPPGEHADEEAPRYGKARPLPRGEPRSGLRSALWLGLVLLVIGGLVAWAVLRSGGQPAPTRRFQSSGPMPVGTAEATTGDMPIVLSGLGTVTPIAIVTVKTQINGQLTEVAFHEGQTVKKGDFLAQIDPRPYQVALEQAEAQLAKDQAALKNAETDLARYRTLVAQNSIARQTADTQAALVQQDKATLNVDQAQIDTQKLNLAYCRIVAPVGGRVGLRQVDPGNYVTASDPNGIVVITQMQPISVIFTLPEDNLPAVLRRLNAGATLAVTAYDRTGTTRLDSGTLQTVDNQIDTSTGTIKLRAVFDNREQILFPNQFVNAYLLVDTLHDATLVPTAAIQRGAPGTFVYVVKPDHTVTAQPVTLGQSQNDRIAVAKGLKPGDLVVTDGADRLKDGAEVRIAESGAPAAAQSANGAPAAASAPAQQHPRGQGGGHRRQRSSE